MSQDNALIQANAVAAGESVEAPVDANVDAALVEANKVQPVIAPVEKISTTELAADGTTVEAKPLDREAVRKLAADVINTVNQIVDAL